MSNEKVKCFGASAALCAEATTPKDKDTPTLTLEVAPRSGESVNWDRKITIQLSTSELPIFCGVLSGLLPCLHFKRPDKGIRIERQAGNIYVVATQGRENSFSLPVSIGDTFRLSVFALKRLKAQASLDEGSLTLALRGACALYKPKK